MIKITKAPKPDILVQNEATWTDEYIRFKAGDKTVSKAAEFRYRHPEIKSTLRNESSDKCIFCESKVSHIFPGETDHIIPSSKKPSYIVKWENLGYVCKECNRAKSNYHDEQIPLLNPFTDNPNDHLLFFGPLVLSKTNSQRGYITAELLQLSRTPLIERKKERIRKVQLILEKIATIPQGEAREFLLEQAKAEANIDKEYSATIQNYLQTAGL